MNKETLDKIKRRLEDIKAKDMMTTDVITVTEEMPIYDLANMMLEKHISGMPVVGGDGKIKGIATITDLFVAMGMIKYGTKLGKEDKASREPLTNAVMTKKTVTITENATLNEMIDLMVRDGIHTIPVMRQDKMVGVVGRHDVLRHFYSALKEAIKG